MTQEASQPLVYPGSLRNAVQEVIRQNTSVGYPAPRFRQATLEGEAPNLSMVCEGLIRSATAIEAMEAAVQNHPGLLTLEDYVMRWGVEWGLTVETIELARASSEWFDKLSGYQRYITEGEPPRG